MNKLSNVKLFDYFISLSVILLFAKAISLVALFLLPKSGVEFFINNNNTPRYYNVNFKNMLSLKKNTKKVKKATIIQGLNITNMILKGLFGKGTKGYAIVVLKSSPNKSSIISVGEKFGRYRLKTIFKNKVLFDYNNNQYILYMQKPKTNNVKLSYKKDSSKDSYNNIISKKDITFYLKNPKQIWKDIAISTVKSNNKIKGFRIDRINKNSKMSDLGLKKGDLIIKVNNIELKSYKDVFNIYNNITKLDNIELVVLRNNEEVELEYEIH